jgi:hypothetical protein
MLEAEKAQGRILQATPAETEQRFERELQRDHELRWVFSIGGWAIAISTFAMIYILSIAFARTSPWLMALPLYMIATRALAFVSWKALLYPRFLLRLEDADAGVAARAVLDRHRPAIVKPILKSLLRDADASAIAAIDASELASLARQHDIERHRRLARRSFVAWCVLSIVVWGTVIATGGGPSN